MELSEQGADQDDARLRAEAQAHRNQRLESLSQLAGGVAHDFNNMLGVILNYANFVIEEAESAEPDVGMIANDARQIIRAGQRGTDLTHRLLAFARRETVQPEVLDLKAVLHGIEATLRASAGEQIRLILRPDGNLPPVMCDRSRIEQLIVNLVVNARDAMPAGGNLVIDAASHEQRVRLRVIDSGRGMTPDVLEHAFEPFFTTKSSGERGLGLATVYGIATQAGGEVGITSEPGLGTTVTVLLPAWVPVEAAASGAAASHG